ncbi:MAG: phosphoenolpyruvate--protein phosphotransferase [Epsilonproteobacteria bacterium]|nr:MAG: phosphoenolpyruvate--protein phosphotransferase [Campylobacterota bacterium]
MQKVILKAPLSGVIYPIEQVPDPVFAQKMVGDGLSIDPTSQTLCAPIDGTVTQIHSALHAVTLTHSSGLEVMMHIGLDTVILKSKGFEAHVQKDQEVKRGDALIDFDMDYVATHAKSLMTQIILTNGELVASVEKAEAFAKCAESTFMTVTLKDELVCKSHAEEESEVIVSEVVIIPNTTGLHARPAAVLAAAAKKFDAKLTLLKGEESANAKSVVGIMSLNIQYQDKLQLSATGSDAQAAIDELLPQIQSGLGDEDSKPIISPPVAEITSEQEPAPAPKSNDPDLFIGISASPGVVVGIAVHIREEHFDFAEEATESHAENMRLDKAIIEAKNQLEELRVSLQKESNASKAAIFSAHHELLDDPELIDIASSMIDKGKSAEYGWQHAYTLYAKKLEGLKNNLLAERANDLRDVGKRLLRILTGQEPTVLQIPDNAILIAEEITPSFTASIDTHKVKGLCSTTGGATSHVAIIARSLDIPAIVGVEAQILEIPEGEVLILNAEKGTLRTNASKALIDKTLQQQRTLLREKAKNLKMALEPAVTTDGISIEVAANIGGLKDAIQSVKLGGEGVGLLRSEFLFLDRVSAPTEEEQYEVYRDILLALDGKPLLVRTLDVGGDKPLTYLPLPVEENPFLGERGIRIGLERPEIFRVQARAVLRASAHGKIRIMFPMISTIDEIREVKRMLEQEREKLRVAPIETGIMVEVPSTAILAEQFAKEVDFFSIGTNDLTQYTLAMDRGHPKLAAKIDALNPAVLRLIKLTADGAHKEGKWVGVCGGIASDPQAVPVLLGLGIDELSVSVPSIPEIKAEVRRYAMYECRPIAQKALVCATSSEVRAFLESKRKKS